MKRLTMILLFVLPAAAISAQEVKRDFAAVEKIYTESPDQLKYLLARDPANPWLEHFFGLRLSDRGRLEFGIEALERAVKLDPGQAWHRKTLAELQLMAGRPDEAVAAFEEAIERESRDEARSLLLDQKRTAEAARLGKQNREEEMAEFKSRLRGLIALALVLLGAGLFLAFGRTRA